MAGLGSSSLATAINPQDKRCVTSLPAPTTRFAPSPTGLLHLGHAYAAIIAHDQARRAGGSFLLRIEDIDGARSRTHLALEIEADLAWLGLNWDGPVLHQSARLDHYAAAAAQLKAMGLLYPCRCTRSDILGAATRTGAEGPIYPGTCRDRQVDPEGAAWRLNLARATALAGPLTWQDLRFGPQTARPELFGDVVLVRKDAPSSYHLAATLDDAAQGVTLVTRGTDLFPATHIHRLLQALLHLSTPLYLHHPLLVEPDGRKLAKRRHSSPIKDLRMRNDDGAALAAALRAGAFPAGLSLSAGLEGQV